MKLLLDENLPHQLRNEIVEHDVFTVAYMGWSGIDNGRLLQEAHVANFDALISNDRGLVVWSRYRESARSGGSLASGRKYHGIDSALAAEIACGARPTETVPVRESRFELARISQPPPPLAPPSA